MALQGNDFAKHLVRGNQVSLHVEGGEQVSGLVHGIDKELDTVMISRRLDSKDPTAEFTAVTLSSIKKVNVIQTVDPSKQSRLPVPISKQLEAQSITFPKGVSKDGRAIFTLLSRQMNCSWSRLNMIVQDDVLIAPPYNINNLKSSKPQALNYVKKVLINTREKLGLDIQ